jgi:acetyl/propionyl-CoA carboxylase alpha subunit/acetyl-CoA carboxylase carboxyltransferase component
VSADFTRVAIVNRGEAAVRLVRAVREFNRERGTALRTLGLFTDPDRHALFVREVDEAYPLGSPTFVDPGDGRRKGRYLDYGALERTLREARADAVWVGWGFVAEHAEFAELCRKLGLVFIGPSPEVMRALGDKIGSKRLAEQAGVPVAPWSGGAVASLADARRHAQRLGFPLMVKATAGGGGRGIRRVRGADELVDAFESAREEALGTFGDDTVFLERLLEGARHTEVQILADGRGATWALGVRDCTIQRRNQKVLEESPSPALRDDEQRALCDAAVRLADAAGYQSAGTVEFLFEPKERRFSFMEVNARLQVEHPVTEAVTGLDLVKLQLHVARGGRLEGPPPVPRGHAIELRLNAEDPERGFAPAPGRIELLSLPGGPGIRIDSGFVEGDRVAPEFDSMLAKLIAWGRDREEALARLERALSEARVVLRGGASNRGFLLGLLRRPEVRSGEVDIGWLDRLAATGEHLSRDHADVALIQAAIEVDEAECAMERAQFLAQAARGRPRARAEPGRTLELRSRGTRCVLHVHRLGPRSWRVEHDGVQVRAEVEHRGRFERLLRVAGRGHRILASTEGPELRIEVEGLPHRLTRDEGGVVRAPAPGVVLSILVAEGDEVAAGERLALLEAMKTELPVMAPTDGRVRSVLVAPNVQVDAGAPLLLMEPAVGEDLHVAGEPVDLRGLAGAGRSAREPGERCREVLEDLRRLVLGFELEEGEARRLLDERRRLCAGLAPDDPELLAREDEILTTFADLRGLFRRRVDGDDARGGRSAAEQLNSYLRDLDPRAEDLSPEFLDRLQRALAHYGVASLDRSPSLEEALLWIWKAHERRELQAAVVLSLLEGRLEAAELLAPRLGEPFRGLLDRVIESTRGVDQALADLARQVRYRYFDSAFFDGVRERVYGEADTQLAALAQGTHGAERAAHVQALVECPQPLVGVLTHRIVSAPRALREVMLEVLMRRYYRMRRLTDLRAAESGGRSCVAARYEREGRPIHLFTTAADLGELESAAAALAQRLAEAPAGEDVIVDLYLGRAAPHEDAEATAASLRERLAGVPWPRPVRRIVVAISAAGGRHGMGAMQHFTFRPGDGGLQEDRLYRGLHPMMGKRLQIWRLENFEIERLPSAEDVYVFHGVARSNPRDERLFVFVEVRDLTPVRDASGRLVALPHFEMMAQEGLATIRLFQSRRSGRRLHWNRLQLYVWPVVGLDADELSELAHRLAPASEGLGLEKVVVRARVRDATGSVRDRVIQLTQPEGREVVLSFRDPVERPIQPLSEYAQKVVRMRQRGLAYPYEVIRMLTPPRDGTRAEFPPGEFLEHDLDEAGRLAPVERPPGRNQANLVVGLIRNFTAKHPEGMDRVLLMGDPSRSMGALAEPECRRVLAALELAGEKRLPVDWFALSSGAKIAMDSGTENLDWTAAVLRRLIEFTEGGGEVNVVVNGINVGAQSYWNAEATMLMHTRGILIMTPGGSMVLTGKKALDYSGGVSAEDHQGIGGYERIMGPNGEAQYWARDLGDACHVLLRHHEHAYVAPGELFPRRAPTRDPVDRDLTAHPLVGDDGTGFTRVGDLFRDETNPGRRKPFDVRTVMGGLVDQDHSPLERWHDLREADTAVVWDAHLGGQPICLIGIESRTLPRTGFVPADGPEQWSAATLYPLSSKKVARAIHGASGSRPVVILANLSGFDGSPESLRRLQLEYGAEIGRAVVKFRGPMVFCGISRYHGGAYVVFSRRLNEGLEVLALEGSYASVIGGAPAAAVVFSAEVERRARSDPRLLSIEQEIAEATEIERGRLRARWHDLYEAVHSEKLGEVAEEFDRVHSVERAQRVGSLHHIVPAARLRPFLIEAVERGMRRAREAAAAPERATR